MTWTRESGRERDISSHSLSIDRGERKKVGIDGGQKKKGLG